MQVISRAQAKALGLPRYFVTKPCRRGHSAERYVGGGNCVECQRLRMQPYNAEQHAAWYQRNKEQVAARSAQYHKENRAATLASQKAWREANKDRLREKKTAYAKANRGAANARQARRRAAERRATPAWADKAAIAEIYKQAARLGLEVDHEIPIAGELVCGLHVHNNLRMLTARENKAKYNKFDPAILGT